MGRVRLRQGTREFDERRATVMKLRDKRLTWDEIASIYNRSADTVRSYVYPKCKVKIDYREHEEYRGELPELTDDEKVEARNDYLTQRRKSSMLGSAQKFAMERTFGVKNTEREIDRGMKLVMGGKQWRGNAD